jgi:hypothetical protein
VTSQTDQQKPKPHWREVKLRRVALLFVIIVGGLAALAVSHSVVTWYFLPYRVVHELAQGEAIAWVVPTPLPDTTLAPLTGLRVEEFGYSMQFPWPVAVPADTRSKSIPIVRFPNGAGALFEDPAHQLVSLVGLTRGSKEAHAELSRLMGAGTAVSDYAMLDAALSMTPDQIHWWTPRRRAARAMILMETKTILPGEARSIHAIHGDKVRGFQLGDPRNEDIRLLLFDEHDRCYELTLYPKGLYTQPQINAIVASFQPRP